MTLDEFIQAGLKGDRIRSRFVDENGFDELYMRLGPRHIGHAGIVDPVLTFARVEATRLGKGTFTRLLARLERDYPKLTIYVECVLNERLGHFLLRNGFVPAAVDCEYWRAGK